MLYIRIYIPNMRKQNSSDLFINCGGENDMLELSGIIPSENRCFDVQVLNEQSIEMKDLMLYDFRSTSEVELEQFEASLGIRGDMEIQENPIVQMIEYNIVQSEEAHKIAATQQNVIVQNRQQQSVEKMKNLTSNKGRNKLKPKQMKAKQNKKRPKTQKKQKQRKIYKKLKQELPQNNSGTKLKKLICKKKNANKISVAKQKQIKRQKNQTKNTIKNYGKSIISFVHNHQNLITNILESINSQFTYQYIDQQLQSRKKHMAKIENLRQLWNKFEFSKQMRIISEHIIRKHSFHWIFNSRIEDHKSALKYRSRLQTALQVPDKFETLKWP